MYNFLKSRKVCVSFRKEGETYIISLNFKGDLCNLLFFIFERLTIIVNLLGPFWGGCKIWVFKCNF